MESYESLMQAVSVTAAQGQPTQDQPARGRPIPDPGTGEIIGYAPEHGEAELARAIEAARAAQPAWDALGHEERSRLLNAAADAVEAAADALAEIISREQGKPLEGLGSRFEAGACAAWLRATAATPLEPELVIDDGQVRAELHYRPVGIVGVIGPWNWPAMIAVWQIAPALRMGNAVVVKPSEYTPFSVLALVRILNQVLPEGVLSVVAGGRELGAAMTAEPAFGKIMFTGSTETGRAIVRDSAANLPRLTLELGGNDPGIVLPDADPVAIAESLFWGAFINTGQTCAALKRLYVHEDIYEQTIEALAAAAAGVRMGHALSEGSALGPLTTRQQYEIVAELVEQARAAGARIVTGGNPDPEAPGNFYPLTLVADIANDQPLVTREQFGPALPIVKYATIEEAIEMANNSESGLGASVWSADPQRAREVAARIQAGTVWINQHGAVHPMIPFGGTKSSGYGLEFGVEGLKAVAVPQIING